MVVGLLLSSHSLPNRQELSLKARPPPPLVFLPLKALSPASLSCTRLQGLLSLTPGRYSPRCKGIRPKDRRPAFVSTLWSQHRVGRHHPSPTIKKVFFSPSEFVRCSRLPFRSSLHFGLPMSDVPQASLGNDYCCLFPAGKRANLSGNVSLHFSVL